MLRGGAPPVLEIAAPTCHHRSMRPNPLRAKLASGQPAYGAWITIPSPITAEAAAYAGLDYLCIDMQHGVIDYGDAVQLLQAVSLGGATPIVRVPELSTANISTVLDAGAMGVVVPMIDSAEQAAAAASACRFPPVGERSYGAMRAALAEGADYYQRINEEVLCIPMIETMEAVDDLDRILAVPGVDVAYVGPSDLSIAMGYWPGTSEQPFLDMLDRIREACDRHGVAPGIQASPAAAADRLARGFRMVTVLSDFQTFQAALKQAVAYTTAGPPSEGAEPLY